MYVGNHSMYGIFDSPMLIDYLYNEHKVAVVSIACGTVVARCRYSRSGEGLHRFVDPADGAAYLWAQSFLDTLATVNETTTSENRGIDLVGDDGDAGDDY